MTQKNEKRCKLSILVPVLLAVIIFLLYALFKCVNTNKALKEAIPYLMIGETLGSPGLLSANERYPDLKEFPTDKPSLFYIFPRVNCTPCDKSIIFLKKFSKILGDSVSVSGVVLGKMSEAYDLSQKAKLEFPVYVPEDIGQFIAKFRIKLNLSQTIIFSGNETRYIWLGDIKSGNFEEIIKLLRGLANEK